MKKAPLKKQKKPQNINPVANTKSWLNNNIILALVCMCFAILLYANTIPNLYAVDDRVVIKDNPYVMQGLKGIPDVFTSDVFHLKKNMDIDCYRPLSVITFSIENQFFPLNPHVGHFTNAILCGITGFFLCMVLIQVLSGIQPVYVMLVTLIFLAHPVHTEVVANIKGRDEMLSFLNLVLAIWFLLRPYSHTRKNIWLRALPYFFFYLAMLSKESAFIGLLIIPLTLFFSGRVSVKQIFVRSLPFLLLFFVFQLQKYLIMGWSGNSGLNNPVTYPYQTLSAKLMATFVIFSHSVKLLVFPFPLSSNYAYNQIPVTHWASPDFISGVILSVLALYFCFRNISKKQILNFGMLFLGLGLAPELGNVFLRGSIMEERLLYAPVVGIGILLVCFFARLAKLDLRSPFQSRSMYSRLAFSIPMFAILVFYTIQTIARNKVWHDNLTLSSHDVLVSPNSSQIHLQYAEALYQAGKPETDLNQKNENYKKSIEQAHIALAICPLSTEALYSIGNIYQENPMTYDSALFYYQLAIQQLPTYSACYNNIGSIYEKIDKQKLASYYFNKAVQVDPGNATYIANRDANRSNTGLDIKLLSDALKFEDPVLTRHDKEFVKYKSLATQFSNQHDFANAEIYWQMAVEQNPTSGEALMNLSVCYGVLKQYDKNIEVLNKILSIYPNSVIALKNLLITYQYTGNTQKAEECRQRLRSMNAL